MPDDTYRVLVGPVTGPTGAAYSPVWLSALRLAGGFRCAVCCRGFPACGLYSLLAPCAATRPGRSLVTFSINLIVQLLRGAVKWQEADIHS